MLKSSKKELERAAKSAVHYAHTKPDNCADLLRAGIYPAFMQSETFEEYSILLMVDLETKTVYLAMVGPQWNAEKHETWIVEKLSDETAIENDCMTVAASEPVNIGGRIDRFWLREFNSLGTLGTVI